MGNKRSKLFVDRSFQGRLLLRLFMYWTVYHMALWHMLFLFSVLASTMTSDPNTLPRSFADLYVSFIQEHIAIIVCFFVMVPVLARDLLKFSHRVAGPLVRFRNVFNAIADGKPAEAVRLRDADFLEDFEIAYNRMAELYNERMGFSPAPRGDSTDATQPLAVKHSAA